MNCKQSNCHCLGPSTTPYLPHCPQSRPVNLRPHRTFLSVYMSSPLPYFVATSPPCLALPPSFISLTSRPLLLPPSERHPCLVSTALLSRSPLLTPSYQLSPSEKLILSPRSVPFHSLSLYVSYSISHPSYPPRNIPRWSLGAIDAPSTSPPWPSYVVGAILSPSATDARRTKSLVP